MQGRGNPASSVYCSSVPDRPAALPVPLSVRPAPDTMKKESSLHGIGLQSIKSTAMKYHGGVDWQAEGKVYTLTVMLKNESDRTHPDPPTALCIFLCRPRAVFRFRKSLTGFDGLRMKALIRVCNISEGFDDRKQQ